MSPLSALGPPRAPRGGLERRSDQWNFWVMRHAAAFCVIFAHAFALSGKLPMDLLRSIPFLGGMASFGVSMFFGISGFLVSHSWNTQPQPMRFLAHRALRIMPGLCGAIVFALLLGWAYTTLATPNYWSSAQLWAYVADNLRLRNTLSLPGVFEGNPVPQQVTGTFWTLPIEATCYLWVLLLGVLGLLSGPQRTWPVLALALPIIVVWGQSINIFRAIVFADAMPSYFAAFLFGMAVYQGRNYLLRGWRLPLLAWLALASISGLASLEGAAAMLLNVLRVGALVWALTCLAVAVGRVWPEFPGWPDLSYGVYLYGYPIQQALVASFPQWSGWTVLTVSLLLTPVAAALSWYLIESPALGLKRHLADWRATTAPIPDPCRRRK